MLLVSSVVSSVDMTICLFYFVTAWLCLFLLIEQFLKGGPVSIYIIGILTLYLIWVSPAWVSYFLKEWASCCRFVVCIFFSGRCFRIPSCFQVLYCSPCVGVPMLLRVVIGRQCSWFPVDVTYKKRAFWFVCLFPCDPGDEGSGQKWLSCGIMWSCWSLVVSWRWVLAARSFLGW